MGCIIGYHNSISKEITKMLFRNQKSPKPLSQSIFIFETYYNIHVITNIECYLQILNCSKSDKNSGHKIQKHINERSAISKNVQSVISDLLHRIFRQFQNQSKHWHRMLQINIIIYFWNVKLIVNEDPKNTYQWHVIFFTKKIKSEIYWHCHIHRQLHLT